MRRSIVLTRIGCVSFRLAGCGACRPCTLREGRTRRALVLPSRTLLRAPLWRPLSSRPFFERVLSPSNRMNARAEERARCLHTGAKAARPILEPGAAPGWDSAFGEPGRHSGPVCYSYPPPRRRAPSYDPWPQPRGPARATLLPNSETSGAVRTRARHAAARSGSPKGSRARLGQRARGLHARLGGAGHTLALRR